MESDFWKPGLPDHILTPGSMAIQLSFLQDTHQLLLRGLPGCTMGLTHC